MPQRDPFPRYIGLSGPAGSGKDTASDALVRHFSYERYAFADPLRKAVAAILGCPVEMLKDRAFKEAKTALGVSPRRMMQTLGTEWGRQTIRDDMWLQVMAVQSLLSPRVVIPDVRFDNEAEWILSSGGIVIQVDRPGCEPVEGHVSEAGVSKSLLTSRVVNDGDVPDLHRKVENVVLSYVNGLGSMDAQQEQAYGSPTSSAD